MKKNVLLKRISFALCFLMVISIGLVGCGKTDLKSSDATTKTGAQKGGVLKIAIDKEADSLGYPAISTLQLAPLLARPAIEGLVRLDKTGTPIPWLATAWKVNPENKSITLTLRKGVKFHDGTDFNAAAVKWNLEQFIAAKRAEVGQIKSIDVINDNTVQLNLSKMNNMLLINLSSHPGMIISPAAFEKNGKEWAQTHPVGTGPYKFVSWEKGQKIVYKKFDGYWQPGQPLMDGIEFDIIVERMTQIASLKQGEVDVIADLDPKSAKDFKTEGKFDVLTTAVPGQMPQLVPDSLSKESPYSNIKVRQAVMHAIDVPSIVNTLLYGFAEPLKQGTSSKSWAYNPDVKGYPYNPEKAKQLLAEAGYPNGFETKIDSPTASPYPEIAAAMQSYLGKVGIKAKIELRETAGHLQFLLAGGWKNSLFILPGSVVGSEFATHGRSFIPKAHQTRYPLLYVSPKVEDLVGKALVEPNQEIMKTLAKQAMKVETDDDAMLMFLYTVPGLAAKSKQVKDDGIFEVFFPQWTPETAWKSSK